VIELKEQTPCAGLVPLVIGSVTLDEVAAGRMTAIAPHAGRRKALATAFRAAHGIAWPGPGRATGRAGCRALWFDHAHVMLMGPAPDPGLAEVAALVDQSDAWAVVRLDGDDAADVLARLTPLDLRKEHFKRGHSARSELAHMPASITRIGARAYQVMVFRAMAGTMMHEMRVAMQGVAARAAG